MKSAICLIVRNEARDIAEWIAFHALVGFDTQIIFDNRSNDATPAIITAAGRLHDIRYHYWADDSQRSQVVAYEAACTAYKLEFDWIAFIDSDEFLVLTEPITVNTFLERFNDFSGVAVPWAIYGSSGHDDYPEGLVLENFTRRANEDFFPVRHVKSIIRPGFAGTCLNPHCFELRGHVRGSYCDPRGQGAVWFPASAQGGIVPGVTAGLPDYTVCRVNHYFTRSRAHWRKKIERGYPSDHAVRSMSEFDAYDRNEIEDPVALRYVPTVRLDVASIEALVPRAD